MIQHLIFENKWGKVEAGDELSALQTKSNGDRLIYLFID